MRADRAVLLPSLAVNAAGALTALLLVRRLGGIRPVVAKVRKTPGPGADFAALARERFGPLAGAPVTLVGDSHVQEAPAGEAGGGMASYGIGGQRIVDVTGWLDLVLERPGLRRLLVMGGTNDVLAGASPQAVAAAMADLLGQVRAARPEVTLAVFAIPPLPARLLRARVATNAALAETATLCGADFVDWTPQLTGPDGQWAPGLTTDGIHLSGRGKAAVQDLITQAARG